jgi:hypothetical protein
MNLQQHFGSWQNRVKSDWLDVASELEHAAANPKTGYGALSGYRSDVLAAALVEPGDVRRKLAPLSATVDRAVAREAGLRERAIPTAMLAIFDIGNALECVGCPLAEATRATFRDWLVRMDLRRDDPEMFHVWSAGFAALALDEKPAYRRVAANAGVATLPFTAGETFGFNVQALLGHLAAAVERRASISDVTTAWHELLGNFGLLWDTDSLQLGTLLWAARVVHHRIAGVPLGEVAQRLQDDVREVAGVA